MQNQRDRFPLTRSALLALAVLAACSADEQSSKAETNLYTVVREDLPITVKENGELLAAKETMVRSEIEGQATIISLIPEGTRVNAGDKLAELDVSELVEKRANQEIAVEKARNALEQARTQQDILEKELLTKENTATSQLRIAQMELEKLLGANDGKGSEGKNVDMIKRLEELVTPAPEPEQESMEGAAELTASYAHVHPQNYAGLVDKVKKLLKVPGENGDPLQRDMGEMANKILQQADQIRLSMADLKVKEDTALHSHRLAEKQFITRNELDRDVLAYQSQASKVMIAWNDLELLINYTLERDKIELNQNLANATLELERVRASNDAERKKSQFDVDAKQKEFEVATERLSNLTRQIDHAIILSPGPGLVVYARTQERRGSEAVQEGSSVRDRQAIIVLPDNSKLQCVIKVQEAQVDKVAVGQTAHITVEAFPTEVLTGKVTRVAPVADSSNSWMGNDKKVYTTVVELDGTNTDERLKSRMAAAATITIGTVSNVVTVPIQSVRRDRAVNYVWKKTANGPEATKVAVGEHNQEKVEIVGGIVEGDVIYRTPPSGQADPKFDQPALPEVPKSTAAPAAGSDAPGNNSGGGGPGGNGPGGNGPGGADGNGARRQGGRTPRKPYTEMSADELAEARQQLSGMADMMRSRPGADEEQIAKAEKAIAEILKALDENRLEDAQNLRTQMMQSRGNRGGGQGGPGGGGPGGGGGGRQRNGGGEGPGRDGR
ncbi:MAG: efflux RND transporter periplasmic adaptor subunit [Planctomycetes bacterium]|nr:efflux RND transporter periplasmic adaptor subunit [Planctomycetota bacterium]